MRSLTSRSPQVVSARFAAAGTVLLWASAFPAIAVAVRGLGPAGLAVARLTIASAALALAAPFLGVRRPALRDLPLIALCGLAGMTGYQLLLNAGERVVPAGTASLLVATAPVYATVLATVFLGEHPGRRWWAGSAVALAGTAVIAVSHGLRFGSSALIVLAAAVLQGVFHTAQKPLLGRYSGFEVTAYAMWAGTVFILPWTGSLLRALPQAGGAALGSAVFLGVAPSAIGFVLWAYAMARMDVGQATTGLYLVPAAAIVISLVWLGQAPGPAELAGGAIALAGVALAGSQAGKGVKPRPVRSKIVDHPERAMALRSGTGCGRAAESELPDREDRFDRPDLGPRRVLADAGQRGRELLVTEALPVLFAVPQGHDAPAVSHRPGHADPESSGQRTHRVQALRQSRILLGCHASSLTHHQDCHV